jgi:hypothetical protein
MNIFQAITVRIYPATNTKPTRFKATAAVGSIMVSGNYITNNMTDPVKSYRPDYMALFLAEMFCSKYGWNPPVSCGMLKNCDYVFTTSLL